MTSSLSKYEGKLPSPFNFFIQGHFRSILLDDYSPRLGGWGGASRTVSLLMYVTVSQSPEPDPSALHLFAQSKPLEAYCPHNFLKIISPWYHVYNDMGRANL